MQELYYMWIQSNYAKSHVQLEVYPKKKLGQHRGSRGALKVTSHKQIAFQEGLDTVGMDRTSWNFSICDVL